MPGLTSTLLGKQMKKFRLLTEETAVKWRAPIGDVNTAADTFEAGMIVELGSAKVQKVSTSGALIATEGIIGVSYENFTTTLNECAGSGLTTIIINPGHIGQTQQYDTGDTYTQGQILYASNDVSGNFCDAGAGLGVGYLVAQRGSWLEYVWSGRLTT